MTNQNPSRKTIRNLFISLSQFRFVLVILVGLSLGLISPVCGQGTNQTIAREGDDIPGATAQFSSFNNVYLNDAGQVSFSAILSSDSPDDDSGIYLSTGGTLSQLVREGETAPEMNGEFSSFLNLGLNQNGQGSWRAFLRNSTGGNADDIGFYRTLSGPTKMMREGDVITNGNLASPQIPNGFGDNGFSMFFIQISNTSGGNSDDTAVFGTFGVSSPVIIAREGSGLAGETVTFLGAEVNTSLSGRYGVFEAVRNISADGLFRFQVNNGRRQKQ